MGSFGFAHISDLHLSDPGSPAIAELAGKRLLGWLSWRRRRRFEHRPEILDRLVRELAERRPGPLIVSGDLTQIGLPAEFAAARRFLAELGSPEDVLLVPGNHDSYSRSDLASTYELWRDYLGGLKLDGPGPRVDQRGPVLFIGLDSAQPTPMFSARGALGEAQLEALAEILAAPETADLFRVVYLHHPPEPAATSARKRLADGADLLRILEHGGVDLVLHGHEHRPHRGCIKSGGREIPVLGVASASALGRRDEARRATAHLYQLESEGENWRLDLRPLRYRPSSKDFAELPRRDFMIPRRPLSV